MAENKLGIDNIEGVSGEEIINDAGTGADSPDQLTGDDDPAAKVPDASEVKEEEEEDKTGSEEGTGESEEESGNQEEETEEDSENKESEEEGGEEEEEESEEENDVLDNVINNLNEKLGVEIDEETRKNLSNDDKGIEEVTKESARQMMKRGLDNYFQQDPMLQKYKEYVIDNGGSPDDFRQNFMQEQSWQEVEFDSANEQQQENIVREKLLREGHDEETVKRMVDSYKDSGILDTQAKTDLATIQSFEKKDEEAKIEQQKEQQRLREEEEQRVQQEIQSTIYEKGEVNGFPIPENERDSFYKYLQEPADEQTGKTQYQLDLEQKSLEEQLSIPYMMYKGFNVNNEVDQKAKTKKAKNTENDLNKARQKPKSKSNRNKRNSGLNQLGKVSPEEVR